MPIINITAQDIQRQNPPSDGWHLVRVTEIIEKPSKDKTGVNTTFELEVISDGPDQGRRAYALNSSKAPSMCVLPLYCAAMGITTAQLPQDGLAINTDELIGKTLHVQVVTSIYEGKPQSKVSAFLPASVAIPAF